MQKPEEMFDFDGNKSQQTHARLHPCLSLSKKKRKKIVVSDLTIRTNSIFL